MKEHGTIIIFQLIVGNISDLVVLYIWFVLYVYFCFKTPCTSTVVMMFMQIFWKNISNYTSKISKTGYAKASEGIQIKKVQISLSIFFSELRVHRQKKY